MNPRVLIASINGRELGRLEAENGIWTFQYSEAWLSHEQAYALSPHLPLEKAKIVDDSNIRHVQWYFDNLLPEEGQRILLAGDTGVDAADAFSLLEYYGAESAGSLTLLRPGTVEHVSAALKPLSMESLSARIKQLPRVSLTKAAQKRMSLAGAQHKLAVVLNEGGLYEPVGVSPSTHILKPDHPDADYPHSVINEWFVMRLAGRLDLPVPEVRRLYVPEPVYVVARFDRTLTRDGWQRLHVIDACQLLGLDRSFKYAKGSVEILLAIASACRASAIVKARLFSWLVFNALLGNGDAHLKNLSFLVSPSGIQLAPHYDLLSTGAYDSPAFGKQSWPDATMLAWPLPGAEKFAALNVEILLAAADFLNLKHVTARRLIEAQAMRIYKLAVGLYDEVEAENRRLIDTQPALAVTLAGELRCLRTIVHGVIKEMADRLLISSSSGAR